MTQQIPPDAHAGETPCAPAAATAGARRQGTQDPDGYVRPGPLSIHPGSSPGGVVVHIYSVPAARLLRVSTIGPDDNIEQIVADDTAAIAALACDVCLVAYDGDTGERAQWGVSD